MNTEYKGFTINDDFHDAGGKVMYIVDHKAFKVEGYATLNSAKGAITKYLSAMEAAQAKAEEVAATLPYPVEAVPPATVMGKAGNVEVTAADVVKSREEAESDKVMAQLRYNGFVKGVHGFTPKQPDYRSRNKREGVYAGTVDGMPARYRDGIIGRNKESFSTGSRPKNRKQRKAVKMHATQLRAEIVAWPA